MVRTSIYLPEALHYRLQMAAREASQSFSSFLTELAERELVKNKQRQLHQAYGAFEQMQEQIQLKGITSAEIDDVLYGSDEQAAWRGNGGK